MSYVFVIENDTVWSPALSVGKVFHEYVSVLEAAVSTPAGITVFATDYLIFDPAQLATFCRALRGWLAHPIASELGTPVLAILLVMLERSGHPLDLGPGQQIDLSRFADRMPM